MRDFLRFGWWSIREGGGLRRRFLLHPLREWRYYQGLRATYREWKARPEHWHRWRQHPPRDA